MVPLQCFHDQALPFFNLLQPKHIAGETSGSVCRPESTVATMNVNFCFVTQAGARCQIDLIPAQYLSCIPREHQYKKC